MTVLPCAHWEGHKPGEVHREVTMTFARYRAVLSPAHQVLLDRFQLRDAAIKVVGIGSVGTRCWVLLLTAGEGDPLFLQIKEARPSVLEAFAGKSAFPNQGQRVVNGYRLRQPYSQVSCNTNCHQELDTVRGSDVPRAQG